VNGGQDFEQELLDDIYSGIKWVLGGQTDLQDWVVSILFSFRASVTTVLHEFIQHWIPSPTSSECSGYSTTWFNTKNTQHFSTYYIFCVVTINSRYYTIQQQEGGIGNGDTVFFFWGRKLNFLYYFLYFLYYLHVLLSFLSSSSSSSSSSSNP
jgi:hypothetical protein